jgi:hypothetical protein
MRDICSDIGLTQGHNLEWGIVNVWYFRLFLTIESETSTKYQTILNFEDNLRLVVHAKQLLSHHTP